MTKLIICTIILAIACYAQYCATKALKTYEDDESDLPDELKDDTFNF